MKKKKILVGMLLAFASAVALASCDTKKSNKKGDETSSEVVSSSSEEKKSSSEDANSSSETDTKVSVKIHANPADITEVTETKEVTLSSKETDGTKYGTISLTEPTNDYFTFGGWYTDSGLTSEFTSSKITSSITDLYAKWDPIMEDVVTGWAAEASGSVDSFQNLYNDLNGKSLIVEKKLTKDVTYGEFTFCKGNVPEATMFNIQANIEITTSVDNAVLKLTKLTGASGSGDTTLTVNDSSGSTIATKVAKKSEDSGDLEVILPTAGKYTISRDRAVRTSSIVLTQNKQKSKQTAISAKLDESAQFISGQITADNAKQTIKNYITVAANYENGSSASISASQFDIDVTNVDTTKEGVYEVTVTSGNFTDKVSVKIFETTGIKVQDYYISSGGTQNLRKVYLKNSTIDKTNIKVALVAKCGAETITSQASSFDVDADLSTTGEKDVTVKFGSFEESFKVLVVEDVISTLDSVNINVDAAGTVSVAAGNVTFKTINDAIDYFTICGVQGSVTKTINIADGDYEEKVSIRTSNVKLVGASKAGTVLHYDGQAGYYDIANAVWGNGGSAVIFTTTAATGFEATNLTIKNDNDNYDKMKADASNYSSGTNSTQAVALYNQSDKSIIKNCVIKSCHDTLYTRGRQVYDTCDIYGTTDYIFGDMVTAYFTKCNIITVTSETKEGTYGYVGCNNTNGTATTAADYNYGYIFDECVFSHQGIVADGANSLGRTWKDSSLADPNNTKNFASMKQVIMNSTIDSSYRTDDDRYTEMQGYHTNSAWVLEYNNTGEGAITTGTNEVGIIADADTANTYKDYAVIFKLGDDTWTPGVAVVDNKVYYQFNGSDAASGTGYTYKDACQNNTTTIGEGDNLVTVDATTGKFSYNSAGYVQMNETTKLTFNVKAGSSVLIESYPGQYKYKINGIAATANTFSVYFSTATEVVVEATATSYLYYMIVNPEAVEADCDTTYVKPADNQLEDASLSLTSSNVVSWDAVENATSYDVYIDDSTTPTNITTTSYTLETEGCHTVKVVAKADGYLSGEGSSIYAVYTTATALSNVTINIGSDANYKAYFMTELASCTSTIRENGDNGQVGTGVITLTVAAGQTVKIVAYTNAVYVSYNVTANGVTSETQTGDYTVTVTEAGTVTITGLNNNNYYKQIIISDAE